MWRVAILTVLCLTLVVAQDETVEETVEETKAPFKPPPRPKGDVYFAEDFQDPEGVWERWIKSSSKKEGTDVDVAKYNGEWALEAATTEGAQEADFGLVMKEAAKHYAIAAKLERPFNFEEKDSFVVQYEVNFQEGLTCGGAYLKLLSAEDLDLDNFHDKTPYSIMFGPDKCGMSSKVHMIIRFKNPTTGEVEEKHSKQSSDSMEFFNDKKTHLFTLVIHSDGTYHVIVDQNPFLKGNLLEDLTPPINPPKEIDDPNDEKPLDWDDREKLPDPDAVKPDDWDEDAPPKIADPDAAKPDGWLDNGPELIPDPDATPPEDWDTEEDGEWEPPMITNPACEEVGCGEWEAPMIQNPNYKGKWKPPLINNPDYMGIWEPRRIPNPAYFEDETPFFSITPIGAVGFELWSMSKEIYFDNVIVASELAIVNKYAREGWTLKYETERARGGAMSLGPWLDWFVEVANNRPYLWALYALAIVSPFACCAALCVRSKPKDDAARRKKTDEPSPDDTGGKQETKEEPSQEEQVEAFVAEASDDEDKPPPPLETVAEGQDGETTQGETSQGEASQGEASQGEASQGEASQGEASQGEASQGEVSQGEGEGGDSQEEEPPAEGADTAKSTRRRKKGKTRSRRED